MSLNAESLLSIEICLLAIVFLLVAIAGALWNLAGQLRTFTSEAVLYLPERQPPPPEVPPDKVESFVHIPESMLPRRRVKDETPL